MTNREAKAWLQLAEAVQKEFGCSVMFICNNDGQARLEAMAKKLAADTDGGIECIESK